MLALFWTCAALIVIAQVMILRSTRRAFREGPPGDASDRTAVEAGAGGRSAASPRSQSPLMEWVFAVGPAVAIAFLLFATWRAATAPPVMEVRFDGSAISAVTSK